MAIDLPPWLLARPDCAELVAEHGRAFLCLFADSAHLDHCLATGDIRRPSSVRRAAVLKANPVQAQRQKLRQRIESAKRAIKDATARVVAARAEMAQPHSMNTYNAERTIETQQSRITERTAALKRAETDLELFDLLHAERA